MASVYSDTSALSHQSQRLLEEVSRKSSSKIAKLSGIFDDDDIRSSWNAFGLYLSRQLRTGRAITIPQFGVFTFTAPDVILDGVSNPWERDKQFRTPVFIVAKDFAQGYPIKSGIYQSNNIRPYKVHGINGKIAQTKINFTEVGIYCNKTRDQAQLAIQRVIRQLSDGAKKKGSVDMELPNVGVFRIRNLVCAVQFNQFLSRDAKEMTHNFKTIKEKKDRIKSNLTASTIRRFENFKNMSDSMKEYNDNHLEIDDNAKRYLERELAIDVKSLLSPQKQSQKLLRPLSSQNRAQNKAWFATSQKNSLRPTTALNKSTKSLINGYTKRNQKAENDLAFRKLKYWIRQECLNSEDAFIAVCKATLRPNSVNKQSRLTTDNLFNAIKNLQIQIDPVSIQELHRVLDYNKDGFIDLNDWNIVIEEANNAYLQRIKDVISKHGIKTEDVLLTMKIDRNDKSINLTTLKEALKRLDPTLNDGKAISAAKAMLKGTEFIDAVYIIEELGCEYDQLDEAQNYIDPNWFNSMMVRIATKLYNSQDPNVLKFQFEKMDIENLGRLHHIQFKTCIMNCNLGFTINEVQRLIRYLQVDEESKIDYYEFMNEIFSRQQQQFEATQTIQLNGKTQQSEQEFQENDTKNYFTGFTDFATKLKGFMKKNDVQTPQAFIQRVFEFLNAREVKLNTFASFLFQKGFPKSNEEEIQYYVKKMDIDNDGIISEEDVTTFFQRLDYLDEKNYFIDTINDTNKLFSQTRNTPYNPKQEPKLYPVEQLEQQQLNVLIRELKQKLYLKKLSFYDFFKRIDQNADGFITIDEWSQNLDSIIKYSKKIRDGLFAFIDIKKIGMVDYQTFLKALNVSGEGIDLEENKKQQDEWEWTQQTITQIKQWFVHEKLSIEDAFRVMDKDFDGFIGKKDIEAFLLEVLHVSPKDITNDKINRIFKLMDEFKRGQIELTDLKRLLVEKSGENNQNFTVTGGRFTSGRTSFDWRLNAKQQIGLVLSRKFQTLHQSFDAISGHRDRIVYQNFEEWVKNSKALIGFELSDYQIQMVYSDIDPHKKGYLTERDWVMAFSGFSWKNQMVLEIQETTMTHFENENDAFLFFSQGDPKFIYYQAFFQAVRALFGQRFSTSDIQTVWNQLSDTKREKINRVSFISLYDEHHGHKKLAHADKTKEQRPKTALLERKSVDKKTFQDALHKTSNEQFMDQECEKIVRKVKSILRASNKSIKQIFEEFDNDGSGELSNIEFKNAFRSIGIGLTSKEIDYLLNYCDESGDGFINWNEFINKFKLGDAQNRIIDRSKQRLQHINDNIHYYMLSPKDAFRLFNSDRTGMMNYNDFTQLMAKLCLMANEKLPSFAILKDIYQTIDIRKDGLIDMTEWIQTFKQFQPPNASMQGRPMMHQDKNRPQTAEASSKQKTVNPFAYHIEASQEYDRVMQVIGRNRKYLLQTFNDINKIKAVTFSVAKEVLQKVLMSVGVVLEEDHYPLLIKFAERDGIVDYRFMLEVYKERIQRIGIQPNPNLM